MSLFWDLSEHLRPFGRNDGVFFPEKAPESETAFSELIAHRSEVRDQVPVHVPDLVHGFSLGSCPGVVEQESMRLTIDDADPLKELKAFEKRAGLIDPIAEELLHPGNTAHIAVPREWGQPIRCEEISSVRSVRHLFQ